MNRNGDIEQIREEWSWMVQGEDGWLERPGDPDERLPFTSALLDLYEAVAITDREGYLPNSPMTLHIRNARDRISRIRGDGLDAQ